MRKPWVIGLLSIVPGLGLIFLGRLRQGVTLAALVIFFFAAGALFSAWEDLSITLMTFGLIAWGTIGWYAVVAAQRQMRAEAGLDLPVRPVSLAPLSPGASSGEKLLYKARETVLALLRPGEHLQVALQGRTGTTSLISMLLAGPSLDVRVIYLGLTKDELIFVNTDRFGKPSDLWRYPLSQVALLEFKEALLTDWLNLNLSEAGTLRVELPRSSREAARDFVKALSHPR